MSRFAMLFVCCVCIAGVFGGAAGAAMTTPDRPADGAALVVGSAVVAGPDAVSVAEATAVGSGVSFMRGAEYPSWVPDTMRGLVPWWMGGKPGTFANHHWRRGGGSGRRVLPFAARDGERDTPAGVSVDDYSELWYDRWVVRYGDEAERYEVDFRQWVNERTDVDVVDMRGVSHDWPEAAELNDDRSDDRYVEDR